LLSILHILQIGFLLFVLLQDEDVQSFAYNTGDFSNDPDTLREGQPIDHHPHFNAYCFGPIYDVDVSDWRK
jgi:hypothetical protein